MTVYLLTGDRYAPEFTVEAGVMRWCSNGRVPPADCVARAVAMRVGVSEAASTAARDAETSAFLASYRESMRDYVPSAEERYEMRAAFGAGAEVVNVITGQRIKV